MLVDTWLTNIEHGILNGVTLIDFRKAFDMINIDRLSNIQAQVLSLRRNSYYLDVFLSDWKM